MRIHAWRSCDRSGPEQKLGPYHFRVYIPVDTTAAVPGEPLEPTRERVAIIRTETDNIGEALEVLAELAPHLETWDAAMGIPRHFPFPNAVDGDEVPKI